MVGIGETLLYLSPFNDVYTTAERVTVSDELGKFGKAAVLVRFTVLSMHLRTATGKTCDVFVNCNWVDNRWQ
jgi:hypothetical protein